MSDVSLGAAKRASERLRELLEGSYRRWETAGHVRRRREGPMSLVHVVIPAAAPLTSAFDNAVWHSIDQEIAAHALEPVPGERPEVGLVACDVRDGRGWHHSIVLATEDNLPARIVQHTGPAGYWQMLLYRLQLAETLKLRGGLVCAIDRSGISERLEPIACPDERAFFKLARTPYRSPHARFARPSSADWLDGILPEWYPPGVRVFLPPHQVTPSRPCRKRGSK